MLTETYAVKHIESQVVFQNKLDNTSQTYYEIQEGLNKTLFRVSQHTNDLLKVQEELSFLDTIDKIMLSCQLFTAILEKVLIRILTIISRRSENERSVLTGGKNRIGDRWFGWYRGDDSRGICQFWGEGLHK